MPVITAFLNRRYDECYREGVQLIQSGLLVFPLIQVVLISLQRLVRADFAERVADTIMAKWPPPPWHRVTYDLTLGRSRVEEAVALSEDDEQRCKAFFYAGARYSTLGRTEQAV